MQYGIEIGIHKNPCNQWFKRIICGVVFHSVPLLSVLSLGDKLRSFGRDDIQSSRCFLTTILGRGVLLRSFGRDDIQSSRCFLTTILGRGVLPRSLGRFDISQTAVSSLPSQPLQTCPPPNRVWQSSHGFRLKIGGSCNSSLSTKGSATLCTAPTRNGKSAQILMS